MIMFLIYSLPFTLEASDSIVHSTSLFTFVFRTLKYTDSCAPARVCTQRTHVHTTVAPKKNRRKRRNPNIPIGLQERMMFARHWLFVFATNFLFYCYCYCRVHDWVNQLAWLYRLIQFVCYGAHTRTHRYTLYLNDLARQWVLCMFALYSRQPGTHTNAHTFLHL